MKIAIISGGFDPIHVGHIELMEKAKSIADSLVVIVNDDDFLTRKKGKPFMSLKERIQIVRSIKYVDMVIKSVDKDQTVCESLKGLASCKTSNEKLLFCNGGDRTSGENTPAHALCLDLGIETVYGLGDKIQSSSWLLKK